MEHPPIPRDHAHVPARRHLGRSGTWALLCLICLDLKPPLGTRDLRHSAHHHLGWPWCETLFFSLHSFSSYLSSSSSRPARRIQSDSDPMWSAPAASPPVAAMEQSKVICSIQVCWRKLGSQQKGLLWPFLKITRLLAGWTPVFLSHPWCRSPSYIASSSERSTRCYCVWREISFLLLLPSLSSLEERLDCLLKARISLLISSTCYFSPPSFGRFLRALELIFALPTLETTDCVSDFPPFGRLSHGGLAGSRYLLEKNFWEDLSVGSLHAFVSCFTWFHKVLGWLSCLALSNQQACVRPWCFTGRLRPLGTDF